MTFCVLSNIKITYDNIYILVAPHCKKGVRSEKLERFDLGHFKLNILKIQQLLRCFLNLFFFKSEFCCKHRFALCTTNLSETSCLISSVVVGCQRERFQSCCGCCNVVDAYNSIVGKEVQNAIHRELGVGMVKRQKSVQKKLLIRFNSSSFAHSKCCL